MTLAEHHLEQGLPVTMDEQAANTNPFLVRVEFRAQPALNTLWAVYSFTDGSRLERNIKEGTERVL